ncbi:MAG: hypothetical protein ACOYMB_01940 [Patescibacteria group bacterium]
MKKKFERKTDYSLQKIIDILDGKINNGYPRCFIINELGSILISKNDENEIGEKKMLTLLESKDDGERALAFCYLSCCDDLAAKHQNLMTSFQEDPKNERLKGFIAKSLESAI